MPVSQKDLQRINRAVEYAEQHLSQMISVATMARHVNMSEFHFHRTFKAVTNEPFNQYMQRKRLEQALFELRAPKQQSIQQIALNCGFSSQANFAKAFGKYFGFSASTYRKGDSDKKSKNGKLSSKIGKTLQPQNLYHGNLSTADRVLLKEQCKDIQIRELETAHYCYVASTEGYSLCGIMQAWAQLAQLLASLDISLQGEKRNVGFCQDNHFLTPFAQCRYEAGYQVDDPQQLLDKNIALRTLAAGRYLTVQFAGKISQLRHPFYLWLFSEYIPSKNILLASKTVMERYFSVDTDRDQIELEILVKVY
ncbi:MAG: AraC family transcriptional regulator [Pseudomonadales bacterium]|nr:AraC family transcriptional regulator [Pseudomonadales bacterium]NRA14277.1 AraC family transcriptional regulator [Oceanospirillaceae bacterium]